jgi:hypothetical protein
MRLLILLIYIAIASPFVILYGMVFCYGNPGKQEKLGFKLRDSMMWLNNKIKLDTNKTID